ncbi:hypothetical protein [Stutzerimonas kirkiae]|uniref:hypothetical protein n=1 Tax=Stutzerimonas kirkiae TaxID=2211392 RepID=UPI0010385A48|nr:hypothetical protein [Stutzerimonas kirkiae]TBV10817.1 hypothetical protein DNK08_05770 [Stutzerimonas kirkiae]
MPKGRIATSESLTQKLGKTTLKNVVDYKIHYKNLNVLDRIARYILAIAYSSAYRATDTYNQAYVAARTVAVALDDNALYIAANSLWGLDNANHLIPYTDLRLVGGDALIEEIRSENITGTDESNIFFIPNRYGLNDRKYHAEMQIVDYFHSNSKRLTGDQIGVSKPCCMHCANALDRVSIEYSYWHNERCGLPTQCRPQRKWW